MNYHYSRYFQYSQLPPRLQQVSKPFCDVAKWLIAVLPDNRMSQLALEKLIEAKDAAVRSALDEPPSSIPMPPAMPETGIGQGVGDGMPREPGAMSQ